MARKRYTTERIIGLLRQDEVGSGCGMEEVLREINATANILPLAERVWRRGD